MLHRGIGIALLAVLSLPLFVRADDDEPTFLDQKLSYWLKLLHEGKDRAARRKGMIGVEQIGYDNSKKVMPALVKALEEDKDPVLRAAAARAVGRAVAKTMANAREDKKEVLPRFDNARDALAKALRGEKVDDVREAAALALGDIGGDARGAVGALALALKDKHTATVRAAATALRRMGRDAREAQAELQTLLADKKADAEARTEAALALGLARPDVAAALPVLREVLADKSADPALRKAVAESIGKLGKDAADASPTLAVVLIDKDSKPELRLAAVTALDQLGAEARAAIPALIKATADSERVVRCLAMQTLGRLGKDLDDNRKEAVKALLKAVDDSNAEVSVAAIESLGALSSEGLGSEADTVVKKLDSILRRGDRKVITNAAAAARDKIRPKKKG
jgi:HEAT repeat protein